MIFRKEFELNLQPQKLAEKLVGDNFRRITDKVIDRVTELYIKEKNMGNCACVCIPLKESVSEILQNPSYNKWEFSIELDLAFDIKKLVVEGVLDLVVFTSEAMVSYGLWDFCAIDIDEDGFDLELEQQMPHCFTEELRSRGLIGALDRELKLKNTNIKSITLTEDQL